MKIVHGFIQDVINKGTEEKPWALVGISETTKNRNGFEETHVMEFMIAGQSFKDGLQNAYRQLKGAEVYVPYVDEIDYFNNKARIRYNLQGMPIKLQKVAPVTAAPQQQQPKTA